MTPNMLSYLLGLFTLPALYFILTNIHPIVLVGLAFIFGWAYWAMKTVDNDDYGDIDN